MRIQVTSVGPVEDREAKTENKFGKKSKYQVVTVNFLANGRASKTMIMSFAKNDVFNTLLNANEGQEFEVLTKEDGKYTVWDTVTPVAAVSEGYAALVGTPGGITTPKAAGSTKFQSTYETPEERAKKQVYIVRQSSLANAIAACKANELDVEELIIIAKKFEAYVFDNTEVKAEQDNEVEVD